MQGIRDILILTGMAIVMITIIYATKAFMSFEDAVINALGFIEAIIIFNFPKDRQEIS